MSNLSFIVGVVSQFMQVLRIDQCKVFLHILRYLKKAPRQDLLYEDKESTQVSGYCNADWATSPIDKHSTIGHCVFIGGNIISWKSKKKKCSCSIKC